MTSTDDPEAATVTEEGGTFESATLGRATSQSHRTSMYALTRLDNEGGGAVSPPAKDGSSPNTDLATATEKSAVAHPPITFPDGGLVAWRTVVGAWLVMFSTFGVVNAFGVFEDYYVRVFITNKTSSDIAWIGSMQLCLMFSMGIVAGRAFDEGYFYHIMISGATLYSFSLFMLSLAHEGAYYQVFLSQGIGAGIGIGLLFLPTASVISHHFLRRRSLATGIAFSGSSVGGIAFPIMLNNLINIRKVGFATGVRAAAGLVTALLALGIALMRTRLPPRKKRPPGPPIDVASFARDWSYVFATLGTVCLVLGIFFPIFYLQLDSIQHGVSRNLAFYSLTILNAASVPGRLLPNFLADVAGTINVMIASSVGCAAVALGMLGLRSPASVVIIALLYGFFSGAVIALLSPMIASLSASVHEIGTRMGLMFFVMGFAALFGTPINGRLLTGQYHWARPIVWSTVFLGAGAALLAVARVWVSRRKGTWKV